MFLEDMNWMNVERYLAHDDRIILITGACEQHSHLSLLTDIRVPTAIARVLAERTGVLVAPSFNFGCSPYFAAYPGTISLSVATFSAVLREVISALHAQGFKRMLVLNGHGGNAVIEPLLSELAVQLPGLRPAAYHWWRDKAAQACAGRLGITPSHANWLENFPFTRVGPVPEGDKPFPERGVAALDATATRALLDDGSYGGPYGQSDEVMAELLAAVIDEAERILNQL